jgi:CspA family cold shock protein
VKSHWIRDGGGERGTRLARRMGHQAPTDATGTPPDEVAEKKISSMRKTLARHILTLLSTFSLRKGMAASMNGTIKRLVSDKGFGFILADDGNEYFFHNSACQGTRFDELREGQSVTFEKGQGPKGPRAESVRVS